MRGDRPELLVDEYSAHRFTPHARGSTVVYCVNHYTPEVYPACAGIDPVHIEKGFMTLSLPRMRGDRPCLDPAGAV